MKWKNTQDFADKIRLKLGINQIDIDTLVYIYLARYFEAISEEGNAKKRIYEAGQHAKALLEILKTSR